MSAFDPKRTILRTSERNRNVLDRLATPGTISMTDGKPVKRSLSRVLRLPARPLLEDRGAMMPGGIDGGWEASAETMSGFWPPTPSIEGQ
jgi:hypothetical protein